MDLSLKERDRISVLRQVKEGVLTAAAAAARIGVTRRHFRRLRRKFEAEGDAAVVHGLRGRRSNRALPQGFRERVLKVARDPLYQDFGPTLLAEHLERSFALRVSPDTLRGWMMEAGLWKRQRRRAKHRSRRPRRAAGPRGCRLVPVGRGRCQAIRLSRRLSFSDGVACATRTRLTARETRSTAAMAWE